ncbi:MAG: DNA-binding protein [Deltaproteobacteria bacterium]|nr:MAG: DNA-binding protein [Deltaproteobacteria bacterium]
MTTKTMPVSSARLWTATEVAEYLRVSRSWVYERAARGDLPHLRFGGHLRFDPAEVVEYARGGSESDAGAVIPLRRGDR